MRALAICTLTLAATAGAAPREFRPDDYAFAIPLAVDGRSPVYSLPLPAEVYRATTRADLGDLCVVNGNGEVVPFAVRRPPAAQSAPAGFASLPLFPLRTADRAPSEALKLRLRTGATQLELDRPADAGGGEAVGAYLIDARAAGGPLTALRLGWPDDAAEFTARVVVEAGEDLTHWQAIVREAAVVNLRFAGQQFLRSDIPLPDTHASFLRLSFAGSAPPLVLTGVSADRRAARTEAERVPVRVDATAGAKPDEYDFDLGARLPLDRLNLELPEPNTVVNAEFLARQEAAAEWRSVAHVRLHRLRLEGLPDLVNPPVAVPPVAARYWRVRIDGAGGGLGRGQPALVGGWLPDELTFVARGSAPFRVLYGSAIAPPLPVASDALLDASGQLRASGRALSPARALAGAPIAEGGPDRLLPPVPAPDWKRYLLWGVLIAGVAALATMAARLSRNR